MSELIKALVAARKEIGGAKKGSVNPAFRSKYADLAAVIEAVKDPLERHGLTFVQDIADQTVVTVILHESGETMRLAPFPIVATKPDAQGHGSALTYARRYSLQTALGVPAEDDDGNAAAAPTPEPPARPDPWTAEKRKAASVAAESGIASYQLWWTAQPAAFRTAAATTQTHADMKAKASEVKEAPRADG
jgi:hypothetical protein